MSIIISNPLYPEQGEPLYPSAPPKGSALATPARTSQAWPPTQVGASVQISTTDHWTWSVDLIEIRPNGWLVRCLSRQPMPLPPVIDGQPYILPYLSGDAWSRRPEAGKIMEIGGRHYKVVGKPKPHRDGISFIYSLAPVSADEYAARPGRVEIRDYTSTLPSDLKYHGNAIGRCVQIGDEWLHVKKITRSAYGSGDGTETFGHITWGHGNFVPAEKAKKLNAKWNAAARVRDIEHQLKISRQDIDYGGNPDAIPRLTEELAEAKRHVR